MSSQQKQATRLRAERILDYFRSSAQRPMSSKALADKLNVDASQIEELEGLLDRLAEQGRVVKTRKGRYGLPGKMNLVIGALSCHEDGYGFVEREDDLRARDIFIPGNKLGDAMHGDRVVARVEHTRKSGKPEGRVIRVLERARKTVVGTFERTKNFGFVVPLDERMVYDVYIPEEEIDASAEGKVVYAEITKYPEGSRNPEGRISEIIGDVDDPRIDVDIIIREYDLSHRFPDEVAEQARAIDGEINEAEIDRRTDFRDLPIVTIDGESAQDFDDAVHVEKLDNGDFRLSVHIADVSAFVPVGSAIDEEAKRRATSVYFHDRVVPMLPEELSNDVCSLRPDVDRLVHSMVIDIDPQGKTVNYEFHDGVIHSSARMTYTDVAAILDGDAEARQEHSEQVGHCERMEELCRVLMQHRRRRGSIDFDLPEPQLLLNLRGEVENIYRQERNIAHRIIEEFMIRANEVVASHLTWEDFPCVYRVHESPDLEKVESFREFAAGLGATLGGGDDPRPSHYQSLIEQLEGTPAERVISTLLLRTMKQAHYSPDNLGHFGLASDRYCHFTSPIRRYPDLLVHRLLKAERGSECVPEFALDELVGELDHLSVTSSRRERLAVEAEREFMDWKMVKFMADKVGETFEGFITGVQSFGMFVELAPHFAEGLVHISSLSDDYYKFDEGKHQLIGENTGRTFTLGDRVKVKVTKVDTERRRLDFQLVKGPLSPVVEPKEEKKEEKGKKADDRRGSKKKERQDGGKGRDRKGKGGRRESKKSEKGRKRKQRRGKGGDGEKRDGGKGKGRGSGEGERGKAKDGGDGQRGKGGGKGRARRAKGDSGSDGKGKSEEKGERSKNPYLTEFDY